MLYIHKFLKCSTSMFDHSNLKKKKIWPENEYFPLDGLQFLLQISNCQTISCQSLTKLNSLYYNLPACLNLFYWERNMREIFFVHAAMYNEIYIFYFLSPIPLQSIKLQHIALLKESMYFSTWTIHLFVIF